MDEVNMEIPYASNEIPDAISQIDVNHEIQFDVGQSSRGEMQSGFELQLGCEVVEVIENNDSPNRFVGKVFPTLEDAYDWYNKYSLSKGFGTRIHWSLKSKKTNEIIRRRYVCDKERIKRVRDGDGTREIKCYRNKRTGCGAFMEIRILDSSRWIIDKFEGSHNHGLTSPSKVHKHRSHSTFRRSEACKTLMDDLGSTGLKPSAIARTVNAIVGGHSEITPKQCSAYICNGRKSNMGKECLGIIKHFHDKSTSDGEFFFSMDLGDDGTLKSIIWADGRSREDYSKFGDVLVFDVTYRTNKFKLPFAPFVGVNHHRQSILFGGALLADETEETFVWLFRQFLKCMDGIAPPAIITDQDKAMANAIKKVFPFTRHRFCSWHISKHVVEHLAPFRSQYLDFDVKYKELTKSDTVEEFETRWESFRQMYNVDDNSWMGKMYSMRHHWVNAFLKDHFFAGMSSSGRSESINAFFDGYLNCNTMLNDFVVQYDVAANARREAENNEDFVTLSSQAILISGHPIEIQASKSYTRALFKIFQTQWKKSHQLFHEKLIKKGNVVTYRVGILEVDKERWRKVKFESVGNEFRSSCSCAKFETEGILCKHILFIIIRKSISSIPPCYILDRWTINARFQVRGVRGMPKELDTSNLNMWSIHSRINKFLEDGHHYPDLIKKLCECVDGLTIEVAKLKAKEQSQRHDFCSEDVSNNIEFIHVRDPVQPIRGKGRPRVASRIKSSLEMSQSIKKKRTCGYCGDKGHYITGCPKKKALLGASQFTESANI